MAILPVKSPCTLTIIARVAPLVLLVVAVHVVSDTKDLTTDNID